MRARAEGSGLVLLRTASLLAAVAVSGIAQMPTGAIFGTVQDESERVIQGARVVVVNQETGSSREAESGGDGTFLVAGLPPGRYEVRAEAEGFRTLVQTAVVRTGGNARVDLQLPIGVLEQIVEAIDQIPPLDYEKHAIGGIVSRFQIENLPLNGREFLQLAALEPGVTTAPLGGFLARQIDVSILSAPPERTRVTMDAGPIYSPVAGGTPQSFSQEVVQEFQISTVNFDLSTGLTASGAVNVATRYGGNEYHGSGFFFFRDHNLAAYPALRREPSNPDPYFARRQVGFHVGGPLKSNRVFFFTSFEHSNEDGAVTVQPRVREFSHLGGIFPNSFTGNQVTARFDIRINDKNSMFVRYAHNGNDGLTPPAQQGNLPSNWVSNSNWADQGVASLTSVFRPNLINEFRLSYWYWNTRNRPPDSEECPGECAGLGMPEISVLGADLVVGNFVLVPQGGDFRRYNILDQVSWKKGDHQFRFGFEWQFDRGDGFLTIVDPASMVLYSPEVVRAYNSDPLVPPREKIPLPASFGGLDELLQLPLVGFSVGVGNPHLPPPFGFDSARTDHIVRFYWQDRWRVKPRFVLNYGLAYHYQTDFANHDLSKPDYLEPLLGSDGLPATEPDRNNFAPSAGLAWTVTRDYKTVLRAGAGIYYELPLALDRLRERAVIGPRGAGRVIVDGSLIPNPVFGLPTVPPGRPLDFPNGPTQFTGTHFMTLLPDLKPFLQERLGDPRNVDLSVRNIEVFKQGTGLLARDFAAPYSFHFNVGVQRELPGDLFLSGDFVLRRFVDQNTGDIDLNHWNSAGGSVVPACRGFQVLDPSAQCSTGPIGVQLSAGRSRYAGLLVRLNREWSQNFQFGVAYALSSSVGLNGIINKDDWFESYGPTAGDRRHNLTASGIADLPWGFRFSFFSKFLSGPPFRAQVFGLDFNGDGTINDVLPGTTWNELNRGLGKKGLRNLVADFNANLAGRSTPAGQTIPGIVLPGEFDFGDSFFSFDTRFGKVFRFRERYELNAFIEVFNLFNVANLTGHGVNLLEPSAFGQPSNRATQVFGSGGPRAFQLGFRFTF